MEPIDIPSIMDRALRSAIHRISNLEKDLATVERCLDEYVGQEEELSILYGSIEAVLALHQDEGGYCIICDGGTEPFPCPTRKVLAVYVQENPK